MKYKIGVYGSSIVEADGSTQLAQELGIVLAQKNVIVITGGCSGLPYAVASTAKLHRAEVWGFTPEIDEEAQKKAFPQDDITIYDKLFYIPQNYDQILLTGKKLHSSQDWGMRQKYRNVSSTGNVDAGVIVSGGWGTMNEFTNLLYEGKPIGVITSTGGLADELPAWFHKLRKKSESRVVFSNSPLEVVSSLLKELDVSLK